MAMRNMDMYIQYFCRKDFSGMGRTIWPSGVKGGGVFSSGKGGAEGLRRRMDVFKWGIRSENDRRGEIVDVVVGQAPWWATGDKK